MSLHHLGEDLAAMADGGAGIDPLKKTELEAHIKDCAACRSALAETRRIFSALSSTPTLEPSSSFDRAVFAKLDSIDRAREPLLSRFRAWLTVPRLALGTSLAAALALAVVFVGRPTDPLSGGEIRQQIETIEVAEHLDLLRDYDVIDNLDAAEDLDVIEHLDEGEPG
jgi:anti-sigma factor RsiW